MSPAIWPRAERTAVRMLHLDSDRETFTDRTLLDLPDVLRPGDLVIVNDAATLPASLVGRTGRGTVELRLTSGVPSSGGDTWSAALFGAGSWRQRTEDRPPPPLLRIGDEIEFEPEHPNGLRATVASISTISPRLVELRFDRNEAGLLASLYRAGRPVQYSYLCGPLDLWHVQTAYGAQPWAVEMPSAGWALASRTFQDLRRARIDIAKITHAAGLSSVGDPAIDAALPLPERFDIPERTVRAIEATRTRNGRVLAVGTTVVRALEGAAAENRGTLVPGSGITDLRLHEGYRCQIVDGLLTGLHEPGTSHFELLTAFVPRALLQSATAYAARTGYLGHEFGDTCLILRN